MTTIWENCGERNELTTPLTTIRTPEICNAHDGVKGVYPRASKSLQDQRIEFNARINIDLVKNMEASLIASDLM